MPIAADQSLRSNALSIDVEDYFQVQSLSSAFPAENWDSCESRVEQNVNRLLELLSESGASATFFTLGWIAERHKAMIGRIVAAGHELASHGYDHKRVDGQTPEEFRQDIRRAKAILEDCSGAKVIGYRAATFSVGAHTDWAFPILEEEGYAYSSSVYPVRSDNYSNPDAPRFAFRPSATQALWELPITTVRIGSRNFPCGGGGYFRLLPYSVTRAALRHINGNEGERAIVYLHPWEIDPHQPRPAGVSLKSRFRHYFNLSKTESRLQRLLSDFRWDRVDRVFGDLIQESKG